MALNTVSELVILTGSTLPDNVLTAILGEANRLVAAYLQPHGLSPGGDICKSAELKLAQAELLTRQRLDGSRCNATSLGDYTSSDNLDAIIATLRGTAYQLLDLYIQSQDTLPNTKRILCKRIN